MNPWRLLHNDHAQWLITASAALTHFPTELWWKGEHFWAQTRQLFSRTERRKITKKQKEHKDSISIVETEKFLFLFPKIDAHFNLKPATHLWTKNLQTNKQKKRCSTASFLQGAAQIFVLYMVQPVLHIKTESLSRILSKHVSCKLDVESDNSC